MVGDMSPVSIRFGLGIPDNCLRERWAPELSQQHYDEGPDNYAKKEIVTDTHVISSQCFACKWQGSQESCQLTFQKKIGKVRQEGIPIYAFCISLRNALWTRNFSTKFNNPQTFANIHYERIWKIFEKYPINLREVLGHIFRINLDRIDYNFYNLAVMKTGCIQFQPPK